MKRVILHCDLNNFYASVECMKNPELKNKCVAVSGQIENRHGIILAKNEHAKKFGIKTGDSIFEAKQKCPDLICVPPNFNEYLYLSKLVKEIYHKYSDRIESFGIDEAWIDVSESISLFGSGIQIANKIKDEVYHTYGLTVSIGISDNKIYAKLGSDFKKPNAITEFNQDSVQQTIFHLPVEDLLYVGKATKRKLHALYIYTIGHLAQTPKWFMIEKLGKIGEVLHDFANGIDRSEVALFDRHEKRKSFGNGVTCKRDLYTLEDAKMILYILCESIATRMRQQAKVGSCISVSFRNNELVSFTRQTQMPYASNSSAVFVEFALSLCKEHYSFAIPMRSISVSISKLEKEKQYHQLSFFTNEDKQQRLERCIDQIRKKYGQQSVIRLVVLQDKELTSFSPLEEHLIFPQNYFK